MLESAATHWRAAEIETQAWKRPIVDADGDGVTRASASSDRPSGEEVLEARAVCREKRCPQGSLSICLSEPGRQATMLGQAGQEVKQCLPRTLKSVVVRCPEHILSVPSKAGICRRLEMSRPFLQA